MTSSFKFNEKILFENIQQQGFNAVNNKTVEELAELIQAIQRYRQCVQEQPDGKVFEKYRKNLIEELADVYIVLENTKIIFNIDNIAVQESIFFKQARQAKRIAGELPYVD